MTVYLDSDVSASGSAVFAGGNQVLYVAVDITTVGSRVSLIEMDLADHYLRLGWFALGDSFDAGAGEFEHWRELQWINFLHNLWTPVPSGIGGSSPLVALASRVRWWLSPGTEAHLHVFGL